MAKIFVTAEFAREWLDYDPAVGAFSWRKSPAKNIRAGSVAGGTAGKNGYRYISVSGIEMPAQRWAWLIINGELPPGKLTFKDKDRANIRIDNLVLNVGISGHDHQTKEGRAAYQLVYRSKRRDTDMQKHRQRKYGLDLATYSAMVAEQDNKCAICAQTETATRHGKVKALAVDHDHTTGKIRGLLCSDCNTGIGKLSEDRDRLLAAVRYLDKHADIANVVPLIKENF